MGYNPIGMLSYDDIGNISDEVPNEISQTHYLKYDKIITNPAIYGGDYIISTLREPYACAVVAMLNVCANNRFFDVTTVKGRKKAYEDLWLLSGTKLNRSTGEYVTDKNQIGHSVATFARQNKGIIVNYSSKNNPSLNFFMLAVNNGYSSILGISTACKIMDILV